MKRICFFNSLEFWGGGEKLHLEYALEFRKKYYQVFIGASPTSLLKKEADKHGIPVIPVQVGNLSFLNPWSLWDISRKLRAKNIDTVVFSTSQDFKLVATVSRMARLEKIVYSRGLAVPIKNTLINRFALRRLTHFVANSQATKREALKYFGDVIPEDKLGVVYHGIEIPSNPKSVMPLPAIVDKGSGLILGNAGRLTKQKGQHHLIEIATHLKEAGIEFSVFIAGTGELEDELRTRIVDRGLEEYVHLLGFVEDVDRFMASLDVFVLTSEWEGFGYVLAEAMLYGKPVVGFDVSSNPELVVEGVTGYLVGLGDTLEFTSRIISMSKDEALRFRLGSSGRIRVEEEFDLSLRIADLERFILDSV